MSTSVHVTLLSRLVREGRWTIEETCAAFEQAGRAMGEDATLSVRQLGRWMDGNVGRPRPVSRRVAERFWGYPFERLIGPPRVTPEVLAIHADGDLPPTATRDNASTGSPTSRRHALRTFGGVALGAGA